MNSRKKIKIFIIMISLMLCIILGILIGYEINIAQKPESEQKQESTVIEQIPPIGFPNVGYSCYANSLLQSIFSQEDFIKHFRRSGNGPLFKLLKKLIEAIKNNEVIDSTMMKDIISNVKNTPNTTFKIGVMESADEFFLKLLDQLSEENNPKIKEEFVIKLDEKLKCISCNDEKHAVSDPTPFMTINKDSTISKAIKNAMREEEIDRHCIKCNANKAIKCLSWNKTPNILVLVNNCIDRTMQTKLSYTFDVDYKLHIKDTNYIISSIIIHSGSVNGGHYIANCNRGGQWYEFNDALVTPINKADFREKIKNMEGVVFIYKKV
ncbi:putative ubiquitin carboxyl-terminal hydrolase 8 [Astathelohania contejeani]|uniref:Ubiquitin carboxyl-terminal hydrolase 8 n=1 Tax=Astathelohania contejeani TaxID=164912 RepID=A0ABQ7I1R9_9MICR|nr:putative ubiquitin carboxyl-terminal hydrolase 8 [Thelohania contejeani]